MTDASQAKMILAKDAAKMVGYSTDYVTKLAREGRVLGELRARQWFVDLESVKLFSLHKAAEQRRRQEELRQARLTELARTQVSTLDAISSAEIRQRQPVALALSVVALLCLLVTAKLGFSMYVGQVDSVALLGGVSDVFDRLQVVVPEWLTHQSRSDTVEAVSVEAPDAHAGIVLSQEAFSEEELEKITQSFSDPVEVEPTSSSTGYLRPVFASSTDEMYQYVLVPVTTTASSSAE